jgi:hypothetical protein
VVAVECLDGSDVAAAAAVGFVPASFGYVQAALGAGTGEVAAVALVDRSSTVRDLAEDDPEVETSAAVVVHCSVLAAASSAERATAARDEVGVVASLNLYDDENVSHGAFDGGFRLSGEPYPHLCPVRVTRSQLRLSRALQR